MEQQTVSKRPSTSQFIRKHLESVGEDYVNGTYKAFCKLLKSMEQKCPTYNSFRSYWNVLSTLGLIEFTREESTAKKHLFPKHYYQLNPQKINSKDWKNPRAALDMRLGHTVSDPVTGEPKAKSQLGRRRYDRWVKKIPPKRAGKAARE